MLYLKKKTMTECMCYITLKLNSFGHQLLQGGDKIFEMLHKHENRDKICMMNNFGIAYLAALIGEYKTSRKADTFGTVDRDTRP